MRKKVVNKFILIVSIVLIISFSCEETEEAVLCADASIELVNAMNSFNDSQTSSDCNTLQSAASKYLSNNCLSYDKPVFNFIFLFFNGD